MGQTSRRKPAKLAEKLLHIRLALGLSQNEMIRHLGLTDELSQSNISGFERGVREPSLLVLLRYARIAGVYADALMDDSVDLPEKFPVSARYEWALPHARRK
jgi:transcriptional regulator with XRE-family HTH domain